MPNLVVQEACSVHLFDPIVIYDDTVQLALPKIVDGKIFKNEYGQIERENKEVPAHVRYKLQNYYTNDGEGRTSEAQVYVPYQEIQRLIDTNTRITHTDPSGQPFTRAVQKIEYGQDVTGKTSFLKAYV